MSNTSSGSSTRHSRRSPQTTDSATPIRDGVCYIGLVFKRKNNPADNNEACCGAQIFLHTGEGIVFKGAVAHSGLIASGSFTSLRKSCGDRQPLR